MLSSKGGQRYFELSKPLLSLSLPSSAQPAQAMREPHDGSWAADERATGRTPGPSLAQAPILGLIEQVADERVTLRQRRDQCRRRASKTGAAA